MSSAPSYLQAFLLHPHNKVAVLAASCAAVFASIPYGWSGMALVGALALGTEILAALTVPDLPPFRRMVDGQRATQARAERRARWLTELTGLKDAQALASYEQMHGRVEALYVTAGDSQSSLTRQDVEKLDDLTVDYLGLSVVSRSLQQRKVSTNEELVVKRIASTKAQLQSPTLPEQERRQLLATLKEYTEVMQRARRLEIRRNALEATLMAMPDKMEEVYQAVIASPYSSDLSDTLEKSLARLRIAEDVAAELNGTPGADLDGISAVDVPERWVSSDETARAGRKAAQARAAQAHKN